MNTPNSQNRVSLDTEVLLVRRIFAFSNNTQPITCNYIPAITSNSEIKWTNTLENISTYGAGYLPDVHSNLSTVTGLTCNYLTTYLSNAASNLGFVGITDFSNLSASVSTQSNVLGTQIYTMSNTWIPNQLTTLSNSVIDLSNFVISNATGSSNAVLRYQYTASINTIFYSIGALSNYVYNYNTSNNINISNLSTNLTNTSNNLQGKITGLSNSTTNNIAFSNLSSYVNAVSLQSINLYSNASNAILGTRALLDSNVSNVSSNTSNISVASNVLNQRITTLSNWVGGFTVTVTSNDLTSTKEGIFQYPEFTGNVGILTPQNSNYALDVNGAINTKDIIINTVSFSTFSTTTAHNFSNLSTYVNTIGGSGTTNLSNLSTFVSNINVNVSNLSAYTLALSNYAVSIDSNLSNYSTTTTTNLSNLSAYTLALSNYTKSIDSNLSNYSTTTTTNLSNLSAYTLALSNYTGSIDSNLSNYSTITTTNISNLSAYTLALSNYTKSIDSNLSNYSTITTTNLSNLSAYTKSIDINLSNYSTTTTADLSNLSAYTQALSNYTKSIDSNLSNYSTITTTNLSNLSAYTQALSNYTKSIDSNLSNYSTTTTTNLSNLSAYTLALSNYTKSIDSNLSNYSTITTTNLSNLSAYTKTIDSNLSNYSTLLNYPNMTLSTLLVSAGSIGIGISNRNDLLAALDINNIDVNYNKLYVRSNTNPYLIVSSNGYVGVNCNTPQINLDVNGEINATQAIRTPFIVQTSPKIYVYNSNYTITATGEYIQLSNVYGSYPLLSYETSNSIQYKAPYDGLYSIELEALYTCDPTNGSATIEWLNSNQSYSSNTLFYNTSGGVSTTTSNTILSKQIKYLTSNDYILFRTSLPTSASIANPYLSVTYHG